MSSHDFKKLETEINLALEKSCHVLLSDLPRVAHYENIFDRSTETGFYGPDGPRGEGEQPTWEPNPAYMDSLEEIWKPVAGILEQRGLRLEKPLRALFHLSYEYKDRAAEHRRIFHGQLMDAHHEKPVTYFMLNIPHSHEGFKYITSPRIQIAESL